MAYLAVSTLVINTAPGKQTEVIGLLNMHLSPADHMKRGRSFYYFRGQDRAGVQWPLQAGKGTEKA